MANPFTQVEKEEVYRRYEAGEPAAQIAAALGRTAFTVGGVIRAYRVKKGEIPDPLAGKRGFRHPKPAPQAMPDEQERPPRMRVVTHVDMPRNGQQTKPTDGIPLFLDGAARLEVHRKRSRPPNPVMQGFLGEVPGGTTLTELAAEFGGGEYRLVGWDARGKPLGERSLGIAGDSVGAAESPQYVAAAPSTDHRLFDMLDRERMTAEERRREDLQREERAAERERIRQEQESHRQREWLQSQQAMQTQQMATLMQMQQNASAAQMQVMTTLLSTAMNQGNKLTDMMTALGAMKDLVGGGGDEDATVSLIKAAPSLMESLKDFGKMKMVGAAGQQAQAPEQQQQTDEQLGQQAAANMLTILMRKGYTQAEAEQEVMKVYGYLDKRVRDKSEPKGPAPRRAPPAASPSNGSGASTAAGSAGPAPTNPAPTVQQ